MSDIRLINDSEQTALLSTALNGEIYMKAAGSTDEGALLFLIADRGERLLMKL